MEVFRLINLSFQGVNNWNESQATINHRKLNLNNNIIYIYLQSLFTYIRIPLTTTSSLHLYNMTDILDKDLKVCVRCVVLDSQLVRLICLQSTKNHFPLMLFKNHSCSLKFSFSIPSSFVYSFVITKPTNQASKHLVLYGLFSLCLLNMLEKFRIKEKAFS